ncbi:MAG: hypothetical protein LH619_12500 [Chitinophagaceae bacterium]|nr:hypothetical protein [Chitinophagaceae bacterium]
MKNVYPDSQIALAAAITQACFLHINKNDNPVAYITIKNSTEQFDTITYPHNNRAGIKFDNISARKYFVLIHTTQQYAVLNKTIEKSDE